MSENYDDIKSPHILEKLQKTPWERHGEIDDLIALERLTRDGPKSYAGAMRLSALKAAYPDDYLKLAAEVSPERKAQADEEIAARAKQNADLARQQADREKAAKKSWKKVGGPQ